MIPAEKHPHVILRLREFLLIEACPEEWKPLDLYLLRDDEVAFYVGQSYGAFERVWQHIHDGFKGHSVIGRFILCNWPAALNFTIELMNSQSSAFAAQGNQVVACEQSLIEKHAPCFNRAGNRQPTPLPARYDPPNVPIKSPHTPKGLAREARYLTKAQKKKAWMAEEL